MTYKLSNYLLIDDYNVDNDISKIRLVSLSNIKKTKITNHVKDVVFTISKYDYETDNFETIKNRLIDEEKIKEKDVKEIKDFLVNYIDAILNYTSTEEVN